MKLSGKISSQYINNDEEILRAKCYKSTPYPHLAMPNLLSKVFFSEVYSFIKNDNYRFEVDSDYDVSISPFAFIPLVEMMYGKDFLSLLNGLLTESYTVHEEQYPSIRKYTGEKGIPIHNDIDFVGAVSFLYTNPWQKNYGGELELFNENLESISLVPPIQNLFVFIPITAKSIHAVRPSTKYSTLRESIFFPFSRKEV